MHTNIDPKPSRREIRLPQPGSPWRQATTDAALEFDRFRVLLRQRQLFVDGVAVELGSRAFDLLVVLIEADGLLVSKEELIRRLWPDIAVSEGNLKLQICALRRALGADHHLIRTEFGRGYRFTGVLRSIAGTDSCGRGTRGRRRYGRTFFPRSCQA
jgi:DNA-binding winged helix-turn-helix (wHTH) protein